MTGTTLRHPGDRSPRSSSTFPAAGLSIYPMTWRAASASSCSPGEARCPYRNAQLSAFQQVLDGLAAVDASILELSVNDEATTRDLIARHGLRFPVGHSADSTAVADATGAFADPRPALPAVGRLRARPRRPGHRQRVLQRRLRAARPARRHRPHPLPARTRPASQPDERQRTQRTCGRSCCLCPSP